MSDKNTIAKIKRWKKYIDEHNANILYKPGKESHVAYALSRQATHALESHLQSDIATIHSEISVSYSIETVDKPVNCFRNQIIIEEGTADNTRTFIIFGNKSRHVIQLVNKESLVGRIRDVVNGICCELLLLAFIKNRLIEEFPA